MNKSLVIIVFMFDWCCVCGLTPKQSCCNELPPDFRRVQPPPGYPSMDHNHCPAFMTG